MLQYVSTCSHNATRLQHLATSARNLNRQSTSLHLRSNADAPPWERIPSGLATPLASVAETTGASSKVAFRDSMMSCAWDQAATGNGADRKRELRAATGRTGSSTTTSSSGRPRKCCGL